MNAILIYMVAAATLNRAESSFSIEKYPPNYAFTSIALAHKPGWVYGYTEYECINNCNPLGKCFIDTSSTQHDCVDTDTPAPIAKTYHYKQTTHDECLSRCGKLGGTDYDWCYVDQKKNWDYCNGDTANEWVHDQKYTKNSEPCKTACNSNCGYFYCTVTCETYWNTTETCDATKGYNFVRAKTINNKPCTGVCTFGSKTYRWCYHGTGKRDYDYCAEPLVPWYGNWLDTMYTLSTQGSIHEQVVD